MSEGKVLSNIVWRFFERIIAQGITFVVSIILARLIAPEEYGAIAIVMVVINMATIFVSNGFATALIQKKQADDVDFSSVFYFSLVFSVFVYALLYCGAPVLARWYDMPILTATLRVVGLRLIIGAVNSVQQSYVARNMMFRKYFWSTLLGSVAAAVAGIVMAYAGYGIWALAAQYMINTTVDTIVLWFTVRWRPKKVFSFARLQGLLSYGWKLLASALSGAMYDNVRAFLIGKVYSSADLAYYTKGQQFPSLIVQNINTAVFSVCFPALSQMQDDRSRLNAANLHCTRVLTATLAPLLVGLSAMAPGVVSLLLTDKWLPCVPFLRIWSAYFLISILYNLYLQSFKAIGMSGLSLAIEISDYATGLLLLLLTYRLGPIAIAVGMVASRMVAFIISMVRYRSLFDCALRVQWGILLLPIAVSLAMGVFVAAINPANQLLLMPVQVLSGAALYIGLSVAMKVPGVLFWLDKGKSILRRFKR